MWIEQVSSNVLDGIKALDRFSLVEVPGTMASELIDALGRVRIKE